MYQSTLRPTRDDPAAFAGTNRFLVGIATILLFFYDRNDPMDLNHHGEFWPFMTKQEQHELAAAVK